MFFGLQNTTSSRCWEQIGKRKTTLNRKRTVEYKGQRLLPSRPIYLQPHNILADEQELRALEEQGLIVISYVGKFITVSDAVALASGKEVDLTGQRFDYSYVVDPQPVNGSKLCRDLERVVTTVEDVVEVEPPTEESLPVEPPPMELDLSTVAFVFDPLKIDITKEVVTENPGFTPFLEEGEEAPARAQEVDKADLLTLKEAATYLSKSMKWLKAQIKKGVLSEVPGHPGKLNYHDVATLASEMIQ